MIRSTARLFRLRLALLNGISALGGYLLFPGEPGAVGVSTAVIGVLLLAAGGSALNQVLERDLDRLMQRTRSRPIPRGDFTPTMATALGSASILAGMLVLLTSGGPLPALLGASAVAWYLGVYTPLKLRTHLALAIGAVCGAIPPVIGWCIAGGDPADHRALFLSALLYLWQIPHFWLFQRRHARDYHTIGVPLYGTSAGSGSLSCIFGVWLAALIAASMLVPAFGIIRGNTAIWYTVFPLPMLVMILVRSENALFSYLNLFPVVLPFMLIAQK